MCESLKIVQWDYIYKTKMLDKTFSEVTSHYLHTVYLLKICLLELLTLSFISKLIIKCIHLDNLKFNYSNIFEVY